MSTLSSSSTQDTKDAISTTPTVGECQAFHPVETDDSVTLLAFKAPVIAREKDESSVNKKPKKEAYFDICLDVSGSMSGSGIKCARLAMKRLIDHLIKTCGVPAYRITVYLFSHICTVRRVGSDGADKWINTISASGGKVEKRNAVERWAFESFFFCLHCLPPV